MLIDAYACTCALTCIFFGRGLKGISMFAGGGDVEDGPMPIFGNSS